MKKLVIILIVVLGILCGGALAASHGQAYIMIGDYLIKMPLWLAWSGILLVWCIIYLLYSITNLICFLPSLLQKYLQQRQQAKIVQDNIKGLLCIHTHEWENAEQYLSHDMSLINCIFAAQAAYEQGAWQRSQSYITRAYDLSPKNKVALHILQTKIYIAQHSYPEACNSISLISQTSPYLPYLGDIILNMVNNNNLGQENLLNLLSLISKCKITTGQRDLTMKILIYQKICQLAADNPQLLLQLWNDLPYKLRYEPKILIIFTKSLGSTPSVVIEIESIMRKLVTKSWDEDIVLHYGILQADPVKQLKTVENWLKQYTQEWSLLLTAGILAMRCQLWNQSKLYLMASLAIHPTPDTHVALGRLFTKLGEHQESIYHYKLAANRKEIISFLPSKDAL